MEHEAATPKQPSAVKETRFSRDSRARERPRVDRFAELGELIGNRGAGLFLQAKLNVSRPDDPHEREADRIAETVLRMRDSASADESDVRMTQPKCDCTGPSSECPRCSDEQPRIQRASISASIGPLPHSQALDENHDEAEDKLIQAREDPGAPGSGAFDLVGYVDDLPGGGEPLPPAVRSVFEPRFGCDLSHVRIHTDAGAAESARAIGAMAYSAGSNIVFGHGQFQPRSHDGQRLIAHELTHAIQQTPLSARNVPFQHDGFTPAADTRATLAPHPGASQMIFRQPEPRAALRPCLTVGREGQGMLLKEPIEMRGEKAVYAVWGFWREGDTMETFARHTMTAWINWRFSGMSAAERAKTIAVIETIPGLGESELAPSEISAGCFYPLGLTQKLLSQFRIASGEIAREKQRAKEIEAEEAAVPVGSEEVATRPPPTEPAPGVRKTPGEQPSKRGEPTKGNWEVLAGNEPLAQRYLKQMQHFAGLPLSPSVSALASGGLTAEELTTIVGESAVYKHYTDLFTQSYTEFQSAGGSDLERFAPLVETVLQQFTWGNPTAVSNLLSIGKGKSWIPEEAKQLGIAHRLEGWLLYDENGAPLRSITGQQWRDPGYVGARQPSWGFNIGEISDPALRGILNSLRQQVGDPNRMVVQAARALHENIELVKPKVAEGLTEEVIKKFEDALPMFIGFLAGHGLAQLLTMSGNPYLVAIGVALKALLAAAGYIMDIDFAASAMERLLLAARFLSRVARDDNGKLTDLSLEYLDKAAVPLRDMVADLAMLTAFVGFGRLLAAIKGRGGERPRIECHSCAIEPKPGEARQAGTVEKSVPVEPSKAGPEAKPRAAEPGAPEAKPSAVEPGAPEVKPAPAEPGAPEAKPSAVEPGAPEVKPAPTEPGAPEAKHPAEPVTPKAEEPKARKRKTKEPTLEEQQRQTRTESLTSQLQNKKDLHRTIVDEIVDITRELKDLREQQRQKPTTERANTIRDLEAQQRQLASESSLVLDETARLDRKIAESKLPLYDKVRAATPTAKAAEGALKRAAGKDQVSGQTASNLQVDHLNPVKEVTTYEGFDRLSWEQQKTACDLPGNLVVMEGGANASKGSRSWEEWPQWQDFYKDPAVKARMLALEAAAHIEIKNYIAETLKSSK